MAIHDYNNPAHFSHACLGVDVYCYECKKLCAMSNTKELEGRRLCYNCYNKIMGYSWIDELPHKKSVDMNVGGAYCPELDIHWEDTI